MAEITNVGELRSAIAGEFEPYSFEKRYLLVEFEEPNDTTEDVVARVETNGVFGTDYRELLDEVLINLLRV